MNHTSPHKGYLRIWTTTAGGSLPVQGVPVQIRDETGHILHVLRTGESGLTPTAELSAPPASDSLTPGSSAAPYALYLVTVELSGYQPVREMAVPVFDGITSLQPITLVPAQDEDTVPMLQPYLIHSQAPYQRLRQNSAVPSDTQPDPRDNTGRRPIDNAPDSEDVPDTAGDTELYWDDNDLPEYGRGTK